MAKRWESIDEKPVGCQSFAADLVDRTAGDALAVYGGRCVTMSFYTFVRRVRLDNDVCLEAVEVVADGIPASVEQLWLEEVVVSEQSPWHQRELAIPKPQNWAGLEVAVAVVLCVVNLSRLDHRPV